MSTEAAKTGSGASAAAGEGEGVSAGTGGGSASTEGVYGRLTNYGDLGFSKFIRRAFLNSAGLDSEDIDRPAVGIVNTTSDYTTCHREMPQMIEAVKRGVLEAGGLPFVFPVMSLGEILTNPTTMLFRNLMAMEVEEQITSQPMDAVVLLGGCDKTVPAELMAAASADIPAIQLVVGPMTVGNYRGERLGACTDCRRMWTEFRGGRIDEQQLGEINAQLAPSAGTCMVMGTASTMACLVEAMGMSLPFAGTAPSVSAERLRISVATGRQAVELARSGRKPSEIMTEAAFKNTIVVLSAIAGSTNAIIHLTAIARRLGLDIDLDDFHEISQRTPVLVNCKPAGSNYLPDMHRDGGVPALLKTLEEALDLDALTVTGKTLREQLQSAEGPQDWQDTIRRVDDPLKAPGGLVTLRGSLAPDGAVIKAAAASPHLMVHEGIAHVFDSLEEVEETLDDESLGLTPEHVLVMRRIGPVGAGMPEAGSIPIPKYLARQGIRDMVRVSDGRMSGTAYGTIVLHVSPEAALGGPLALVRNGDRIRLDVPNRTVDLLVDEAELERRRAELVLPQPPKRGWRRLYATNVVQASEGADLGFLRGVE
ncbi:MAG: dihydroxy-acid dehydratase [Leucobacter sp.]